MAPKTALRLYLTVGVHLKIMNNKISSIFLVLVLVQGIHSIEEYVGKLWESFPPARVLCSMLSDNLVTGFLIINIGLFVFGL